MTLPIELVTQLEQEGDDLNSVLDEVRENAGISDEFVTRLMTSLTFFGKSLALWEDEIAVPIPVGKLEAEMVRDLYVELANKIQLANHYYCLTNAATVVSNTGVSIKRSDLVTALVAHYEKEKLKLPPVTVLERLVEGYIKKLSNLSTTNKIIRDFWRQKLETLKEVKSCLSSISMSFATEMKYGNME